MKWLIFPFFVLLASCNIGPIQDKYYPQMPETPRAWVQIAGTPHWRLEWLDKNMKWQVREGTGGFNGIALTQEWTVPVFAWPYWPEKGISPGQFSPAGALFPWDVQGNKIMLTWKAGTDAFFWREMARNINVWVSAGTPRYSWYFDWPRFRELMESENIPAEVRQDPWLADWKEIALKTVEMGFDRRRIKPQTRTILPINPDPSLSRFWAGYSAFADLVEARSGEPLNLPVTETAETWIGESGILRCQKGAWIFLPWHEL